VGGKIRLFEVFRYTLTGAWFFFGKNPGDDTVHLWSLNLAFSYPNYIGSVREQHLSGISDDTINVEVEGQGGYTSLYRNQIRYLQKAGKAWQMQCLVDGFREELEKGEKKIPPL